MTNCLITGGCGFLGHHMVEHFLKNTDWNITIIDKLSYASFGFDRLRDIRVWPDSTDRVRVFATDLDDQIEPGVRDEVGPVDIIIHLAAETHVDNSIDHPVPFVLNNVKSTLNMLEFARTLKPKMFVNWSCYDEETMAVTKAGLKRYDELTCEDEVLTLNANKQPEFQKPRRIIVQDYDGDMVRFGGNCSLLVTPNHRMYNNNMDILEAGDVRGTFTFPISLGVEDRVDPQIVVGNTAYDSSDVCYILGVFIGDGFTAYQKKDTISNSILKRDMQTGRFRAEPAEQHINTCHSWRIFFDVPERDKARERLEATLTRLGVKWHAQKGAAGEHIFFTSKEWLKFFDEHVGRGAHDKRIPNFAWNLGLSSLNALYDGLIDSDGHRRPNYKIHSYTSCSQELCIQVALLANLIGRRAYLKSRLSESCLDGRKIAGVAYDDVLSTNPAKTARITREHYAGKIWCIEVANKNFLVYRDGRMVFSGNTDEVYGPAPYGFTGFKEFDAHHPSNPYAASKSAQESLGIAWSNTYGVPVINCHTMNLIGERQMPEKYVPLVINKVLRGEKLFIHADKTKTKAGSRFYLHCRNASDALLHVINLGYHGYDEWNIAGLEEVDNLTLAQFIADVVGKPLIYELTDFHSERPGHDLRYALDSSKLIASGYQYPKGLWESLEQTVKWSLNNRRWL